MNELRVNDLLALDPMEDMYRGLLRPWRIDTLDRTPRISVDLNESDGNYILKAEVPGVRKEDIEVRVDGNQVTINAEVKKETEDKQGGRVMRSERYQGRSSRTLWLDCPVDEGRATARYENGVLQLTLPKSTSSSAKRLSIS
ncbi:MAG: Hsp20/alpha crystallin family protein [Burkholderiaceae bacterium]|nr:Hsp20/alpha crystallin family protein [Burkholderiaceae bacterium]